MDQLLKHQVPAGMAIKGRDRQHLLERPDIAVQVADDHHLGGLFERDDSPESSWRGTHQRGRAANGGQDLLRVGHDGKFPRRGEVDALPVGLERGLPVLVQ